MRKFIPIIILLLGLVVLIAAVIFVRNKGKNDLIQPESDNDIALTEVNFSNRPYVSLTPSSDGHWLTLKVEKIKIDAQTLDYELLYQSGEGRTLGVPGSIKLTDTTTIERKLLLGSESSGKFRFDEGVEKGTVTLKFRNDKGKLVAKFQSDFVLKNMEKELQSNDGIASFTFENAIPQYIVLMNTIGLQENKITGVKSGPYGLFSSLDAKDIIIKVKFSGHNSVYIYENGDFVMLEEGITNKLGVFASI